MIITIRYSFYILLIILFATCKSNENKNAGSERRPNVILILTDDQGWGDLQMHGNKKLSTPVVDQLAKTGAQFDRFYVSPLCAPTRASLLTGRYHLRTGTSWVSKGLENMRSREVTLAEVFKEQGYRTGCFGKWHNGSHFPQHPNQQGFDEFIGFCAGHWSNYFSTTLEHNGEPYATNGYISDVLANEALRFIKESKEDNFFCYVPFNAPHGPFQVPDKYFDKYKAMGFNNKDAAVYGMCENIDYNIGRIVSRVEELGLSENTIIIFLTDNGPNGKRYNGGMRGVKGSIHEGGVRVPCIINWESEILPKVVEEVTGHIDLLPTLVSLCNLEPPETLPLDGIDLSEALVKEEPLLTERLFFSKKSTEHLIADGAARSNRFRFVIEKGDTMLFDMQNDPGQNNNISDQDEDMTEAFAKAYNQWFKDVTGEFQPDTEIRIGYKHEKVAHLPAHEAGFSGAISFMEGHGWAHDWLMNWNSTEDSIYWDVVVESPSSYEVALLYSCPMENIGANVSIECGEQVISSTIVDAHDPEYLPSPDRIKRIEVYEKEWKYLPMGILSLPQGDQRIILKAEKIPNSFVGEIKGLKLLKVN